jgi:hypothetical protein
MKITLIPLKESFTIYQFEINAEIPKKIVSSSFCSITRTGEELSVVTNCDVEFENAKVSKVWKGFKVDGLLDFSLVGIIHEITKPLKENSISVFVLSTYNTDYIFVKEENYSRTKEIFQSLNGFSVKCDN